MSIPDVGPATLSQFHLIDITQAKTIVVVWLSIKNFGLPSREDHFRKKNKWN